MRVIFFILQKNNDANKKNSALRKLVRRLFYYYCSLEVDAAGFFLNTNKRVTRTSQTDARVPEKQGINFMWPYLLI